MSTKNIKKIRIVDICAYFVHKPQSGGQVRVFSLNQAMSKYANIEQFSFTPVLMWEKAFAYNKDYKEHVHNPLFYTKGVVLLKILGIKNYDSLVPFIFKFIKTPSKLVEALERADLVQVEHPWLLNWVSKYIPKHANKPIILIAHNVEYDLQKNFFNKAVFRKRIVNSIKRTEQRAIKKANLVFAMSKEDKKRLIKLYNTRENKVFVVPNGTNIKDFSVKKGEQEDREKNKKQDRKQDRKGIGLEKNKPVVIFMGSKHPPNKRAVEFIEEQLAPKLKHVLFMILGNIREKGKKENVVYTGGVENKELAPYLRASDIAINPTTQGSGSSLKMFDYMAAGLPVISTRKGMRGIDASHGKDVLISNLKDFSDTIATLINDKQLQDSLRRNSKKIVKKYDWGVIASSALKYYKRLM